jgi:hypothetical protein
LYHTIAEQIAAVTAPQALPDYAQTRLSLLTTGILAAQSCVLAQVAAALDGLALTEATLPEHIERRLRRTLNDSQLTAPTCYQPVLPEVLPWDELRAAQGRVVLIIDESSHTDQIHLLRLSLAYRGGAIPLAWAVWRQDEPLADGAYWTHVDTVLHQVAAVIPADLTVILTGDRAYAVPALIDRLQALGWHWVLRLTTTGQHRWRDAAGREHALAEVVKTQLPAAGHRWRSQGQLFKKAGWRDVRLVGVWAAGTKAPLVVLTDLPPRWSVLHWYGRRAWIEPEFRTDKRGGWQWEACQVQGVAHHERLLLGMAWATVIVLCVGVRIATARQQQVAPRERPRHHGPRQPGRPQHARHSLFTLGLRAVPAALWQADSAPLTWTLPELAAPRWTDQWYHLQAHRFLFPPVRP